MKNLFAAAVALFVTTSAFAELKQTDPSTVCSFLADSGLKGRKWVDYGDGSAGCASDYKDIGTGSPLPNNLAFYATGQDNKVSQAKLVLNFNQKTQAASAIAALEQASNKLSKRALGVELPASIKSAIKAGRPSSSQAGGGGIEVTRDEWPTGGYELHVIFK